VPEFRHKEALIIIQESLLLSPKNQEKDYMEHLQDG
jgi:hypothetical protein